MSADRQPAEHGRRGDEVDSGLAWLAAAPAAALALLGPPLGRLLFPLDTAEFWPTALHLVDPEPTEDARYLLSLLAAILVPLFVLWVGGRRSRPVVPRGVVLAQQVVLVLVLVLAVFCRRGSVHLDVSYFNLPTVAVALAIGVGLAVAVSSPALLARLRPLLSSRSRLLTWGALAVAAAATVIWLLPVIQLDTTIARAQPPPPTTCSTPSTRVSPF